MRIPSVLISLTVLLASQPHHIAALPPLFDNLINVVEKRQCAVPCGYLNSYCCSVGSVCYTDTATRAQCAASSLYYATAVAQASASGMQVFTTTYTDLVPRTSTYTIYPTPVVAATPTSYYVAQSTAICYAPSTPCGAICCASGQYCYTLGMCEPITTTVAIVGSTYSAPLRPTSVTTVTSVAVTTTQPFSTPVSTGGSTIGITAASTSPGLSGGAIAGIVIGVIAGIILLILICFCCILKAGFDGVLSLLGLRNNRRTRERTEVIEERRYSRYGGSAAAGSRRDTHNGWFGGGGRKVEEKRTSKTKEAGILGGLALGLAGLWALLGLRGKQKEKRAPASEVSYSDYTESYTATSASSASSDRRTRQSRR